jgi:soluble cytochrome b562/predicted small secreted protein
MTFTETINSLIQDSIDCDMIMQKCLIFSESSYREFGINCKEAELKVIKESGTQSDYDVLVEAATEGLIQRIKKTIQKAINALMEFLDNVVTKVKSTFASKKTKDTIDKMEKMCETNPKLKSSKITMYDIEKDCKCIQEGMDKLDAKQAKIKAGHTSESDSEDINNITEETQKKRTKIIAATAAVTLTVGAAIALFKKYVSELDNGKSISDAKKEAKDVEIPDHVDDEVLRNIQQIKLSKLTLTKEKVATIVDGTKTLFGKIKGQVVSENLEVKESPDDLSDVYNTALSTEVFGESTEDYDDADVMIESDALLDAMFTDIEGDVLTEGANKEFKSAFKEARKEFKESVKKAKVYKNEGKKNEAKKEINNARKALDKASDTIDLVEPSIGSAVLAYIVLGIRDSIVWFIPIAATFGIAGFALEIKRIVEFLTGIIKDIKEDNISASTFNMIRNRTITAISVMNKTLDKMEASLDETTTESVDDILADLESEVLSESDSNSYDEYDDIDELLESMNEIIDEDSSSYTTESVDEYLENLERSIFSE